MKKVINGKNLLIGIAELSSESISTIWLHEPEVPQQLLKKRQVKETASKEKNV